MAKKVTVTLVDDFDGDGAADETVEFSLDGVSYEIDLSAKNAQKLRDELKRWMDAGRRGWVVGVAVAPGHRPAALGFDRSRAERVDPGMGSQQRPQGVYRGRIPADIIEAYHAATS